MLEHPFGSNFGVILGGLGDSGALSGSWALPEPFQGASGAPPGRSGVLLGAQDGGLGFLSWAQVDLKSGPRGFQNGSKNDASFGRPPECENGARMGAGNPKMKRKWIQNTAKLGTQRQQKTIGL